jgi:hypothetical protein
MPASLTKQQRRSLLAAWLGWAFKRGFCHTCAHDHTDIPRTSPCPECVASSE